MKDNLDLVRNWYNANYTDRGFDAQRLYPNEEFCRFMGRNFFSIPKKERKNVQILEIGCGSCANLWMVANEGFSTYGLDISKESINLGYKMMKKRHCKADLKIGSMTNIPWADNSFDAVADILAAYCLEEENFKFCINEVVRVLKPGGKFFSYTPGKKSMAYIDYHPAILIDSSTLNGIHRKNSPFSGNHFPHRFVSPDEYEKQMINAGMKVRYLETVTRTYRNMNEDFEFVVSEAIKI